MELISWLRTLCVADRKRECKVAVKNFASITAHTGHSPDVKLLKQIKDINSHPSTYPLGE